jgi:hypothetical protein
VRGGAFLPELAEYVALIYSWPAFPVKEIRGTVLVIYLFAIIPQNEITRNVPPLSGCFSLLQNNHFYELYISTILQPLLNFFNTNFTISCSGSSVSG